MKNALLYLLFVLTSTATYSKDFYFKHIGTVDGLSQTCIYSIYQDEIGAMWFGSSEGLNRYNGNEIKIYQPSQDNEGLTNNEINELCGDKQGHIYIRSGSDLIRYDIDKERFTSVRRKDVKGIFCQDSTLWIICEKAIYTYHPQKNALQLFANLPDGLGEGRAIHADTKDLWVLTHNHLIRLDPDKKTPTKTIMKFEKGGRCITQDRSGNLWIGTWDGLYCIDKQDSIRRFTDETGKDGLSNNQVRSVIEDADGQIWIGTFRGLDCYNPSSNTWSHYVHEDFSPNSLSHNSIYALYEDSHHNIWAGTYFGGVNVFTPSHHSKQFYTASLGHEDRLSFPFVGKIAEDDSGNLWICTEGGGMNKFNLSTGSFSRYIHQENNPQSVGNNNIKTIYYHQPNQRLYIGTHTGGLSILDIQSNTFRTPNPNIPVTLKNAANIINEIQPYKDGIAILTQGGLFFMDLNTESYSSFTEQPQIRATLEKQFAYETFHIDSQNRLWLALSTGGLTCIHLSTHKVEQFETNAGNPSSIGKFKVVHIFEDSHGEMYFCTIGSGLFKFQTESHSFKVYNSQNKALPTNYCYYIRESSENHKLLLLHNKGLSIFNPKTETVEQTYRPFRQSYSQGSTLFITRDKTIYIGGSNGLASFPEQYLHATPDRGKLCFEKLLIFNREVLPDDATGILKHILAKTSDINLEHDQNNITVTFSSFDYLSECENLFEYRFDNLDIHWTKATGNSITYTNIPPGHYTLRVRHLNPGTDAGQEIALNIYVAAPFYANPYAYTLYALLFAGILYVFFLIKMRQARLQSSLENEKKEKERIEELNQSKLRFFTNISHEFRTPLTLIIGQLEAMMQINKLEPSIYKRILRVYKNAWHLRNLITELLDFRKQEQGYLKLKVEECNLISFINEIYNCFYEYSQIKNIHYNFIHADETIKVWFDPVQLQKVIFNLLSNAFKYTAQGGTISISVQQTSSLVLISVSDNGQGIPEESIHKIFDRFYQVDSTSSTFSLGTGIGLALAKGIMDAHHGNIEIKSTINQGSSFTLSLLPGNQHFNKEDFAVSKYQTDVVSMENITSDFLPEIFTPEIASEAETETSKSTLLLVEDNQELLEMLSDMFSAFYEVHTACNGREGLTAVEQIQPDIIVSDVMMPEMSGKEMCYRLKNNVEFSHIPIVLLTAQNSVEYIVEGYMFGADDYVTKPFNVKILLARCSNLIRNKQQIIAHYSNMPATQITDSMTTVSMHDKELVNKSIAIVKENFDKPDFDVTALASALCMGRSKLYLQFKQMTGLTPNEFILKVKLDEAMSMLKTRPEMNISEVSTYVGFSSPRYFSKCFKAFFGVAPLSVRKRKEE